MVNESKTYELKVEKVIAKPAADIFRAIGEGRLFLNCSADTETLKIDFKVGGKYSLDFMGHNMKNHGEFLEIIKNQKIVFTWCQDYDSTATPDTKVTIVLKDLDGKTSLTLTHSGFSDLEGKKNHEGGWSGGLDDLGQELTIGKLRFNRKFSVPVEKLYDLVKNPASFFGLMGDVNKGTVEFKVGGKFQVPTKKGEVNGEFLEIVPQEKVSFTWLSSCDGPLTHDSKVSLKFEADDDKNASWLELVHDGLVTDSLQKSHRESWDYILKNLK